MVPNLSLLICHQCLFCLSPLTFSLSSSSGKPSAFRHTFHVLPMGCTNPLNLSFLHFISFILTLFILCHFLFSDLVRLEPAGSRVVLHAIKALHMHKHTHTPTYIHLKKKREQQPTMDPRGFSCDPVHMES